MLTHPRLAHVTYYLETPGMDEGYDAINVARARDLAAGRPLATLPPEAMTLRGSRARTARRSTTETGDAAGDDGAPAPPTPECRGRRRSAVEAMRRADGRRARAVVGLVLLAAVMRLPDLATRGTWDADQGHDMLVLRALVRDGVVPLLGPPTSIGDFHHGASYYYLLAPAALLTGGDSPLAVTAVIALGGIAAVAVTWWLAASIAGRSPGSRRGCSWRSRRQPSKSRRSSGTRTSSRSRARSPSRAPGAPGRRQRARWWLLAAAGTAITMQCHVLGVTLLPVIGGLWVADVRRRPPDVSGADGRPRRDLASSASAGSRSSR